jgi:alpha-L-arabinofuranosidase
MDAPRYEGLPVLSESVKWLKQMGVKMIRQGGSFAKGDYYDWQNWLYGNKPWLRKPAMWGHSIISGWGPFEMIALCEKAGIEPVMTTSSKDDPEKMAELLVS